jgi:phosphohistidine swiveling domain-containing protein
MSLPPKPIAPAGVEYVLTVPQSVMFADLSLRGTTRPIFAETFGIDYEPEYVDIDNGAMCWNTGPTDPFVDLLRDGGDVTYALERFIETAGRTGRDLERTSRLFSEALPPPQTRDELLLRFREFWDLYERQSATLFPFFNMDGALAAYAADQLRDAGLTEELGGGLERFLVPSEPNYFVRERINRGRLVSMYARGGAIPETLDAASADLAEALTLHAQHYGFFLAPYSIGTPPGPDSVLKALGETASEIGSEVRLPALEDLPPKIRRLARLSRQLTFWKTERVDVMALSDALMLGHYRVAAGELGCEPQVVFAMTRDEIDSALTSGELQTDADELLARADNYCLVLHEGKIGFYEPSPIVDRSGGAAEPGTVLEGRPASKGAVTGPVRVIYELSDIVNLTPGEILVTQMTRPEFGVALDNAAAFVTDEGGRMCHAAIISREMGKPCVIATRDATTQLDDGMIVEVDGTQGIVTVIERA